MKLVALGMLGAWEYVVGNIGTVDEEDLGAPFALRARYFIASHRRYWEIGAAGESQETAESQGGRLYWQRLLSDRLRCPRCPQHRAKEASRCN